MRMTSSSKVIIGLVLPSLAALSAGCSKEGLTTEKTACSYGGKTYQSGASFPSTDGCNTCSCDVSGAVACTLMGCLPDAGSSHPADAAATTDATPDIQNVSDVGGSGNDARLGGDAAEEARPLADVASEGKSLADAASDAKPAPEAGGSVKDAAVVCIWGDASVPAGQSVSDGCNTCACSDSGAMMCTARPCVIPDAGKDPCLLPTSVAYQDQYDLDASTGLTITRSYVRGIADGAALRSCSPALPACAAPSVVSLSTIVSDLAAADVQASFALTSTPLYGVDQRPVDGAVWSITLASGGSVLVGAPCASPTTSSCWPIPAGVQKLADDLKSLAAAGEADSACAGL